MLSKSCSGSGCGPSVVRALKRSAAMTFRGFSSGDQRSDLGWRYYLLLVDFDVARLENRPTAAIGEVIKRLADAADVYGIDPARRFGVCRPSAHEFQVLERAITFEDSAQICQLFENVVGGCQERKNQQLANTFRHGGSELLSRPRGVNSCAPAVKRCCPPCRGACRTPGLSRGWQGGGDPEVLRRPLIARVTRLIKSI